MPVGVAISPVQWDISPAAPAAVAYAPRWVKNNGEGYLTYDGPAIGVDSAYQDIVFAARSLDTNPTAICRVIENHGARLSIRFNNNGSLYVALQDTSGTALVTWNSTAAIDGAGAWLIHVAADLDAGDGTATPTFVVSRCELTETTPGVWSAGAWAAVAGTFSAGPVAGVVDSARAFSGNDLAVLATPAGGSICNCELGYLWWSQSAPLPDAAFADGGVLFDPATIGTPALLVTGPVATLGTDKSAAARTLVVTGSWTDT